MGPARRTPDHDQHDHAPLGHAPGLRAWRWPLAAVATTTLVWGLPTVPGAGADDGATGLAVPAKVAVQDLGDRPAGEVRVLVQLDTALGIDQVASTTVERSRLAADAVRAADQVDGLGGRAGTALRNVPVLPATVPAAKLRELAAADGVAAVVPDRLNRVALDAAGPATPAQGGAPEQYSFTATGAPSLYGTGLDGAGWSVAVLDTGVRTAHQAFAGRVVGRACFSSEFSSGGTVSHSTCPAPGASPELVGEPCTMSGCSHGTHVAGSAVGARASLDGGEVFQGMAPGGGVVAVQVFSNVDGGAAAWDSDIIRALDWVATNRAALGVAAVNMSLGGGPGDSRCAADAAGADLTGDAVRRLVDAGVVVAVASGNEGSRTAVSHPGCVQGAVTVAATGGLLPGTWSDTITSFSNVTSQVELAAPGAYILSAAASGTTGYTTLSGTSMATPHVAGAALLWRQAHPTAPATQFVADVSGYPVTCGTLDSCATVPRLWVADLAAGGVPTTTTTTSTTTTTTTTTSLPPPTLPPVNRTPLAVLERVGVDRRRITAGGWAADLDLTVPGVQVLVDGRAVGAPVPNQARLDVWQFFSRRITPYSGWGWRSTTDYAKGNHSVCVKVRDANQVGAFPGGWSAPSCRTVTVK